MKREILTKGILALMIMCIFFIQMDIDYVFAKAPKTTGWYFVTDSSLGVRNTPRVETSNKIGEMPKYTLFFASEINNNWAYHSKGWSSINSESLAKKTLFSTERFTHSDSTIRRLPSDQSSIVTEISANSTILVDLSTKVDDVYISCQFNNSVGWITMNSLTAQRPIGITKNFDSERSVNSASALYTNPFENNAQICPLSNGELVMVNMSTKVVGANGNTWILAQTVNDNIGYIDCTFLTNLKPQTDQTDQEVNQSVWKIVPRYQNDGKFASNLYGKSKSASTYKEAGCGPAALATVLSTLTLSEISTPEIGDLCIETGARNYRGENGTNLSNTKLKKGIFEKYNYTLTHVSGNKLANLTIEKYRQKLEEYLQFSPVIVNLPGHYIVIYGIVDDEVFIHDVRMSDDNFGKWSIKENFTLSELHTGNYNKKFKIAGISQTGKPLGYYFMEH